MGGGGGGGGGPSSCAPCSAGMRPLAWESAPPRGIFFPLDEQTYLVENFRNGLVCLVFLLKNTKNSQQLCVLIAVTAKPFLLIT